ncbi:MAG TPA: protein kinase [Polyangia bacterium]|nr:protein kinase [Polyangia bacterium]
MSLVGKKLGNYLITRLLVAGGMGTVYLAEHPIIGRKVAVKVLHPEMARNQEMVLRFFHEARAANDIGDPHIVEVLDLGQTADEEGEVVYLVMEFLDGECLKERLWRQPLAAPEIAHIVDQVASALASSHAKHIIHRDLKPENVFLLRRDGDPLFVKILDFGIAKLLDLPENKSMTRMGTVLGTPEYMSPEQCDGKSVLDHRTDIYALGVMLYEMLTGRLPFSGTMREVLLGQMTAMPPSPFEIAPQVDRGLSAISMRCLAKERAKRYQSMAELRMALLEGGFVPGPLPAGSSEEASHVSRLLLVQAPARSSREVGPAPAEVRRISAELHQAFEEIQRESRVGAPALGPARRRWRWGLAGALVMVPLFLGVELAGAWWSRIRQAPAPRMAPAAAVNHVDVLLFSEPAGAQVVRVGEGKPLGTTPLRVSLVKGRPDFKVQLVLEGYLTETLLVLGDREQQLRTEMRKVPVRVMVSESVRAPSRASGPANRGAGLVAGVGPPVLQAVPAGTLPPSMPAAPQGDRAPGLMLALAPNDALPELLARQPPAASAASAKGPQEAANRLPAAAPAPPPPLASGGPPPSGALARPAAPAMSSSTSAPPARPKNQAHEPELEEYLRRPLPAIPATVKMQYQGSEMTFVAVVCTQESGEVSKVRVLQGIPGADEVIVRTLMGWRLKPQPCPLCYPVRLLYAIE